MVISEVYMYVTCYGKRQIVYKGQKQNKLRLEYLLKEQEKSYM